MPEMQTVPEMQAAHGPYRVDSGKAVTAVRPAADLPGRASGLGSAIILLLSIVVSIGMGEVLLRVFTPFPLGTKSHKIADVNLGYRLSPAMADADDEGFRNSDGKHRNYKVAALGDSNTYGNNVESALSWPGQFEEVTGQKTYNYGVPSYGIYAYHALVKRAVAEKAGGIVIALFPGNDFGSVFSHCDIAAANSPFWRREKARLGLRGLDNAAAKAFCARGTAPLGWKNWIVERSAVAGAVHTSVMPPVKSALDGEARQRKEYYRFSGGVPAVLRSYARENAILSDLDSPATAALFDDFTLLAHDWNESTQGRLGFVILPSKERVVFELLRRRGTLGEAETSFVAGVENEIRLERRIIQFARSENIPVREALKPLAASLERAIRSGESFYPKDDGHPYATGYAAIARMAADVWSDIDARGR